MPHKYDDPARSLCKVPGPQVVAEIDYLDSSSNYREYLPHPDILCESGADNPTVFDTCGRSCIHGLYGPWTWVLGASMLFAGAIYYMCF
jgi:hypothetical protein